MKVAAKGNQPEWSSDGRLAYRIGGSGTTVVVGSTQVKLPFALVTSLAWSPDGTRFIVTARRKGSVVPDVYSVRTDATDPIRLTKNLRRVGSQLALN